MGKKKLRNVFRTTVAAVMCISLLFPAVPLWAASGGMEQNAAETQDSVTPKTLGQYDSIPGLSGEILYDTEGREVQANGGEIHQVEESGQTKWYWFGEDFLGSSTEEGNTVQGIHLYSSTDLYNWTREEDMFKGMTSKQQFETDEYFRNLYGDLSDSEKDIVFECLRYCPTAHPRVLYNEESQQYVMWVPASNGKQCIATSSSIKGPFKFVKYCDSVGGFTEVYKESDGTAYIVYQSGSGISMSKLSDDYMGVAGEAKTVNFSGGSFSPEVGMFKRGGKYYMVHTAARQYAVADSLSGTWTVHALKLYNDAEQTLEDVPDNLTPTHQILQVNTEDGIIYINITESQNAEETRLRYVWLPIKFSEDGTIALQKLSNWKLQNTESEEPEEPEKPKEPGNYDYIPGLSGEILYDTQGQEVYANGGEIHQVEESGETKWYWFGEDFLEPSTGEGSTVRGIHLYSSKDLYNWTREEDMFKGMTSKQQFETDEYFRNLYGNLSDSEKTTVFECLRYCPTAHPRVLYNEESRQYVMWVPASNGKQCIATSSSIKGPFKFVKYCESVEGFTETYKESDGTAYIVYQGRTGIYMSKLTDDYMGVVGEAKTVNFSGGSFSPEVGMFKRGGKYYMVHTAARQYAVADSLSGTWTVHALKLYNDAEQTLEDVPDNLTPTHQILQVNTEDGIIYINITESQNAEETRLRYVWLPIKFSEDGMIALRKLNNWKLENIEPENPSEENPPEENPPVEVTEVRLSETSKTLKVGDKYQIQATVLPANATNRILSYKSSDDSVASVSSTGQVAAKKAGNATVTVTSANGKKAELKVTVETKENPPEENPPVENPPEENPPEENPPVNPPEENPPEENPPVENPPEENPPVENPPVENPPVAVTEVRLSETSKTLKVGDKYQIQATVLPTNATNKYLLYRSSDDSVASVSSTGEVEVRKAGNATVTVTSVNGKKAELKVTVTAAPKEKIDVEKVLVSIDKMTMGVGENVQLEASVYPKNASDKELTYKPSNNKVKVSKTGKITAQKTGTCNITITSSNNKKVVVKVTVKKKPGKISLNSKKKTLKVGKKFQIKPKLPNGTASYKITYTSSKRSVATVSQTGKVTAKKRGNAVITVKTYNGKTAKLKIHVK